MQVCRDRGRRGHLRQAINASYVQEPDLLAVQGLHDCEDGALDQDGTCTAKKDTLQQVTPLT